MYYRMYSTYDDNRPTTFQLGYDVFHFTTRTCPHNHTRQQNTSHRQPFFIADSKMLTYQPSIFTYPKRIQPISAQYSFDDSSPFTQNVRGQFFFSFYLFSFGIFTFESLQYLSVRCSTTKTKLRLCFCSAESHLYFFVERNDKATTADLVLPIDKVLKKTKTEDKKKKKRPSCRLVGMQRRPRRRQRPWNAK